MDIFTFISRSSLELCISAFETSSWSEANNILKKTHTYKETETQCIQKKKGRSFLALTEKQKLRTSQLVESANQKRMLQLTLSPYLLYYHINEIKKTSHIVRYFPFWWRYSSHQCYSHTIF